MSTNIEWWTRTLREGGYAQTNSTLVESKDSGSGEAFCCLGVGCDIADPEDKWGWRANDLPPHEFLVWLGLMGEEDSTEEEDPYIDFPYDMLGRDGKLLRGSVTCAGLNDSLRLTFSQIADLIDYFGVYVNVYEEDED